MTPWHCPKCGWNTTARSHPSVELWHYCRPNIARTFTRLVPTDPTNPKTTTESKGNTND